MGVARSPLGAKPARLSTPIFLLRAWQKGFLFQSVTLVPTYNSRSTLRLTPSQPFACRIAVESPQPVRQVAGEDLERKAG